MQSWKEGSEARILPSHQPGNNCCTDFFSGSLYSELFLLGEPKGKEVNFYLAPYSTLSPKMFFSEIIHLWLSPVRLGRKLHLIIYTSFLGGLCKWHWQHHYYTHYMFIDFVIRWRFLESDSCKYVSYTWVCEQCH